MTRSGLIVILMLAVGWAVAGENQNGQSATGTPSEDLQALERSARVEAAAALAKLELIQARQALKQQQYEPAALKAQRVLALLQQLPPEVDTSADELQAEGVLAIAARHGVDVEALKRDAYVTADVELPPLASDPNLDAKVRQAARLSRGYTGAPTADIDTRGDERTLRARALRQQAHERHGYRPSAEIIDRDALRVRADERVQYHAALAEAYRDSEARMLIEADEARVVPEGVISYPPNWPEIVKKREKYAGGMVARSPSWYDKDGREWYVAIYDIHDLIYVPPDFTPIEFNPIINQRNAQDRAALRWRSQIFNGYPEDLAAGIPLLRYFGGVDDVAYRGPKYSLERQQQIIEMIEAFTGPPEPGAKIIPLAP
ncbi:MAG: hypothetical protein ABIG44_10040 [Planctomycetota bacterium]